MALEVARLTLPVQVDLTSLAAQLSAAPRIATSILREAVRQAGQAALQEARTQGAIRIAQERAAAQESVAAARSTGAQTVAATRGASAERVAQIRKETAEVNAAAKVMSAEIAAEARKGASGAVGAFSGVGERIGRLLSAQSLSNLGQALTQNVSRPLIQIARDALMAGADFQRAQAVFAASSGATGAQMAQVSKLAIQLGNDIRLPGTSATSATEAMMALQQAGLSVANSQAAVRNTIILAAAAHISNKEAAEIGANALNAFNLAGTEMGNVADYLANASLNSGKSIESFGHSIAQGGAVAHMAGLGLQDYLTQVAMLGKAGIEGSDAGTSLKTMFQRLMAPTNEAKGVLNQFGIQVREGSGKMKDINALIGEFSSKLKVGTPFVTAYGGDIGKMDKALKQAEATAKAARAEMERLPNTLRLQSLQLSQLRRDLENVDRPEKQLTETIAKQQREINDLTRDMKRHTEEGLKKLGRESADAKGRIAETTIELELQRRKLAELQKEQSRARPEMRVDIGGTVRLDDTAIKERQLEIVRLQNQIRDSENSLVDWKEQIADADRQMREGLDSDREKKERLSDLGAQLAESKQKLKDWQETGREQASLELKARIDEVTTSMHQNQETLVAAGKAQFDLAVARQNATRVTRAMTAADRDAALATIFGSDAIRAATIVLTGGTAAFQKMRTAVGEQGRAAQIAAAQNSGLHGAIDGLKSQIETTGAALTQKFLGPAAHVLKFVSDLIDRFGKLAPAQMQFALGLGAFAAALGPTLSILGAIGTAVAALGGPLTLAIAGVGALGVAFATNAGGIRTTVMSQIGPALTALSGWFKDARDWVVANWPAIKATAIDVFNGIMAVVRPVATFIAQEFGKTVAWFKENMPLIRQTVQTVLTTIREFWKAHGDQILAIVKVTWEGIKVTVSTVLEAVRGVVKFLLQLVNGDFVGAGKTLLATLVKVGDGFNQLQLIGVRALGNLLKGMISTTIDFKERLVAAFVNLGKQIIEGLIEGIVSMLPRLGIVSQQVADTISNVIRTALAIRSPSQVMFEAGVNVGQGLAQGIKTSTRVVSTAAQGMVAAIGDAFGSAGRLTFVEGGGLAGLMHNIQAATAWNQTSGLIPIYGINQSIAAANRLAATTPTVYHTPAAQPSGSGRGTTMNVHIASVYATDLSDVLDGLNGAALAAERD